jgi:hypothetical protein
MFNYYIDLALRSLKRSPLLTALMALAIGLGIGASMTMITVLHVMSGDPVPDLSSKLFVPMLGPRSPAHTANVHTGINGTPDGFTWTDATNLLRERRADRQAAMGAGAVAVHPVRADLHSFFENGEYVTSDFFAMFGVPFRAGGGWSAVQDQSRARRSWHQSRAGRDRDAFPRRTLVPWAEPLGQGDLAGRWCGSHRGRGGSFVAAQRWHGQRERRQRVTADAARFGNRHLCDAHPFAGPGPCAEAGASRVVSRRSRPRVA